MTKQLYKVTPPKDCTVALMLDSGVFSAWRTGETIDIKQYIAYIKRHQKLLYSYAVVDHIPGKWGVKRTAAEVMGSAQISYDNLQRMKDAGLSPMPIFHQGENIKWLFRMIEDGDRYIGISTAKDLKTSVQSRWLDEVFSLITDKEGRPLIRTHGFGVTNATHLLRYPWFTVDSTTWTLHAGMGHILIPPYEGGLPNYLKKPISLVTSGWIREVAGSERSYERYRLENRKMHEDAVEHFAKTLGVTSEQLRHDSDSRRRAILMYFLELCNRVSDVRFTEKTRSFLSTAKPIRLKAQQPWPLTVIYATMFNKAWEQFMNELGAFPRLMSYYMLRDVSDERFEQYVRTGKSGEGEYVKRTPRAKWNSGTYLTYRSLKLEERLKRYAENRDT